MLLPARSNSCEAAILAWTTGASSWRVRERYFHMAFTLSLVYGDSQYSQEGYLSLGAERL